MNLVFDTSISGGFKNNSQKIRVQTEHWVLRSAFCPNCGENKIEQHPNNRPVADFFCSNCDEEYELKSKAGKFGKKIVDGAYSTMIERLNSNNNPNFFMLSYDKTSQVVKNFLCVPKHFFIPKLVEMRNPLAPSAVRAGWIGCNILFNQIPKSGKVYFVQDGIQTPQKQVMEKWKKTLFLRQEDRLSTKGWLLDILLIIEKIGKQEFTIDDLYQYEHALALLHPDNHHIKDKIRQQLQLLRDKNFLLFTGRGVYRLIY